MNYFSVNVEQNICQDWHAQVSCKQKFYLANLESSERLKKITATLNEFYGKVGQEDE